MLTLPRLSESLAGRMEVLPLFPFSAGEREGGRERFLARLFEGALAKPRATPRHDDVASRLVRGGYPEAVGRRADDRRAAWFASYVSTLLQRDVRDLARVDALHTLPHLLALLASRASGLLSLADVARDAGQPHTTVTRYLALLEMVFLVHRLPAWSVNLGRRLVKAPKLHPVDTGLACHLVGADARRLRADRPLLGRLLESFVVSELRKQISWTEPQTRLYHFRTSAGSEGDAVLERADGTVAGIEVKAGATTCAASHRTPSGPADRPAIDCSYTRLTLGPARLAPAQGDPREDAVRTPTPTAMRCGNCSACRMTRAFWNDRVEDKRDSR